MILWTSLVAIASCSPTGSPEVDAGAVLGKAASVMGIDRLAGRVLRSESVTAAEQSFQSDRWYPPFFSSFDRQVTWYDPQGAVERRTTESYYPGGSGRPMELVVTGRSTWLARDTLLRPLPPMHSFALVQRPLNPWAVVADWRRGGEVRSLGRCAYRDYSRIVLARGQGLEEERLLTDPKTGYPVALLTERDHYLWGQTRVEHIWSNWQDVGDASYPATAFSVVDGRTELSRTVADLRLVPADSAPRLTVPDTSLTMPGNETPQFLMGTQPDTVRIGPSAFLLRNPGYTHAVALLADTVFVLEATQGEARARQDSLWIGRLFPGRHPIVVVVTDVAWPHVAGVRFWVASGATIVTHPVSKPFLARVVAHRWTRRPDALERRRRPMKLRLATDELALGNGGLRLHAIDGITSEGALMAWLPAPRFLWASDYIQRVDESTRYLAEVKAAVRRAKIAPDRFAAQHVGLTEWAKAASLH